MAVLFDVDAVLDLDRDETSEIDDAEIAINTAGYTAGLDEDEEAVEDHTIVEKDLQLGYNHNSYQPLLDKEHERAIRLPDGFFDQPQLIPPLRCTIGCSEACDHRPVGGNSRYDMPLIWFKLFFTNAVFETLAINTNAYAASKDAGKSGGRPWRQVTAAELKVWIGLLVYMSVVRQSRVDELWYRSEDWPRHQICRFMGQTRFQQIKRFFHVSPPFTNLPKNRWFNKLEPLSSMLKKSFKEVVTPASQVTIDEMIIRFTGRSKHTIMMRGKPTPVGFNVLALCDRGYCWS